MKGWIKLSTFFVVILVSSIVFSIWANSSSPIIVTDVAVREVSVVIDGGDLLNISITAHIEANVEEGWNLVFDSANMSALDESIRLPSEWSDALRSSLVRGAVVKILIKGSSLNLSVVVRDLLNYIISDKELYAKYMNFYLNMTAPSPCMGLLGRTGFNVYSMIPEDLRQVVLSEGVMVRFELRTYSIDRDSLNQLASSVASLPHSNVSVSDTGIVIEQQIEGGVSPAVCVPYSRDFWELFGVPRVVFVMPNMPIERGYPTFIQFEVSRVPIQYVEIRYRIPKNAFDAVFPQGSLVDRVNEGYRVVLPESDAEYLYYDNGTVVIRKRDQSVSRLFGPQLLLNVTGFGTVDLGNASIFYCLASSGTCHSATVPVYSLSSGSTSLIIPPPNISAPGMVVDIKTWVLLGLVALAVVIYTMRRGGKV